MNGSGESLTTNSYVIIYRMKGLTFGSGGTNAGIITATALTDGTVTAAIQAGEGQTQMCIYAIPSGKTLLISRLYGHVVGTVTATVQTHLVVYANADTATAGWIHKEHLMMSQLLPLDRVYDPYKIVVGPAMVKIQVNSSANNTRVIAAFDGYVADT